MPDHRCDSCQQLGTFALGKQDRLLRVRVVLNLLDGAEWETTGDTKILHLKCIPAWLEENPDLAITSARLADV